MMVTGAARQMRVADQAHVVKHGEHLVELARVVSHVGGQYVLTEFGTRRSVHEKHVVPLRAERELGQEVPSFFVLIGRLVGDPHPLLGLVDHRRGEAVEPDRAVQQRPVVVAHQREGAVPSDQIRTLDGIGSVPDDVAQAPDLIYALMADLPEHRFECLQVAVDVRDQGFFRHRTSLFARSDAPFDQNMQERQGRTAKR